MKIRLTCLALTPVALAAIAGSATAEQITVTVENTMASDGFFLTPFWAAAHDGSFNVYDKGSPASNFPGLTALAEGGDTGPIGAAFEASSAGKAGGMHTTITAIMAGGDAPVFNPGESATMVMDVGDASVNRYFSYASMVIPSNDLFIANGDPMGEELFDADGVFLGPHVIEVYGYDVLDNGTELNDAFGGAAFSANGGDSTPESETIRNFFSIEGSGDYLDSFIGTQTVTGLTIGSAFEGAELIARITIVPAPAGLALLGLPVLALGRRRRV